MNVYRKPFLYAQRYASRIEWQPQPSWEIDATVATWAWATYSATVVVGIAASVARWAWTTYPAGVQVSGDINISASTANWEWTGYRSTVVSSREIAANVASWAWQGRLAGIESSPLNIPTASIEYSVSRKEMQPRTSHPDIRARVARNSILAKVA